MPGALVMQINDKALDFLGDILLEDSGDTKIIDEYFDSLSELLSHTENKG